MLFCVDDNVLHSWVFYFMAFVGFCGPSFVFCMAMGRLMGRQLVTSTTWGALPIGEAKHIFEGLSVRQPPLQACRRDKVMIGVRVPLAESLTPNASFVLRRSVGLSLCRPDKFISLKKSTPPGSMILLSLRRADHFAQSERSENSTP